MIVEKAPDQTKAPGATDKGETLSCRFEHVKAGWKQRSDIRAEKLRIEDEGKDGRPHKPQHDQDDREQRGGKPESIGKGQWTDHHRMVGHSRYTP